MAEQSAQNVVNQAQSVDENSSIDVSGTSHSSTGAAEFSSETDEANISDKSTSLDLEGCEPAFTTAKKLANGSTLSDYDESNSPSHITDPTTSTTDSHEAPITIQDNGTYDESDDVEYQHSASGDTVHSDPEHIKVDGIDSTAGDGRTERASVVKRPTSFKPVSVTKNFLAKSAVGIAVITKPNSDKISLSGSATPVSALIARPRLVAKSGKDAKLLGLRSGLEGNGPDASKVWNRNRPTAPPPPKQFTDEELKQQYGIHLATRLQSDEPGKEGKWADIDDDEDDWAPEATVEWMDGTKSTATPNDGKVVKLGLGRAQTQTHPEALGAVPGLGLPAQRLSSISSVGKTILRPGARTISQTKPGVVLKSVPESPSTTDKSGTTTTKSPWAPLPPVDKASPVAFNPPPPSKQQVSITRDSASTDTGAAIVSPAREIAADDFSRGWRESEGGSKELFNSQSGRYEPVKGGRRPSRHEPGARPPSLLQRPSQQGVGPIAEPTPGSQNQTSSGDSEGKPLPRRRESSSMGDRNASGRVSEQNSDLAQEGRPSPTTSQTLPSQSDSSILRPPGWTVSGQGNVNAQQVFASRGGNSSDMKAEIGVSAEDTYVIQQRLMREKVELNKRRKQEEEAREEAARKERIRLKMEALGPPAHKELAQQKVEKLAGSQNTNAEDKAEEKASTPSEEGKRVAQPQVLEDQHRQVATNDEPNAKRIKVSSPRAAVVSPVPKNASKQHDIRNILETQAEEVNINHGQKAVFGPSPLAEPKLPPTMPGTPPVSEQQNFLRPMAASTKSPSSASHRLIHSLSDVHSHSGIMQEVVQLPGLGTVSPADQPTQPWTGLPQKVDSALGWSSAASLHPANVWGAPSKDRLLGNGAFDAEFQRSSSLQRTQANQSQVKEAPARFTTRGPDSGFEQLQPVQPNHDMMLADDAIPAQQWLQPYSSMRGAPFPPRHFGAGAPDESMHHQIMDHQQAAKRAWKDFSGAPSRSDTQPQNTMQLQSDILPTFRETYRQTTAGDVLGQRQVVSVSKTIHEGQNSHIGGDSSGVVLPPPYVQSSPVPQSNPSSVVGSNRPSRFFGPAAEKLGNNVFPPNPIVDLALSRPASPPPPDSSEHPAFGRGGLPLVHLPTPAPKVRLPPPPPPSAIHSAVPVTQDFAPPPSRFRSGPQPLVDQKGWQDRFNGLFNRQARPSTNTTAVLAASFVDEIPSMSAISIESSSKTTFDVGSDAATVSLPASYEDDKENIRPIYMIDVGPESKASVEDLMDDREFGDKPTVHIPKLSYQHLSPLHIAPFRTLNGRVFPAEESGLFGTTVKSISFEELDADHKVENGLRVFIRMVGREVQSRILPRRFTSREPSRISKSFRNKRRTNGARESDGNVSGNSGFEPGSNGAGFVRPRPANQTFGQSKFTPAQQQGRIPGTGNANAATNTTELTPVDGNGGSWSRPPKGRHGHGFKDNRM